MGALKEAIYEHLFINVSSVPLITNEVTELNRLFLKSPNDTKHEININRLISDLKTTLHNDNSVIIAHEIRMYTWYYFFYYPNRKTRKLNKEFLNTIAGNKNLEKLLHEECSYLLCDLPMVLDWISSISEIRHMIHLLAHFKTYCEMTQFLYKDHIEELIKALHEFCRILLQVLLNHEVDYSNWETSSLFTGILSLLVDVVSVDMVNKSGVRNTEIIYDLTKSCCQHTIVQVLENVNSLKIPVFSVINAMNLILTVNPNFYLNCDVVSVLLCQNYDFTGNNLVDLIGQNNHLKVIYCAQLMNKISTSILAYDNMLLKIFECIMREEVATNDDALLSSITALNRWYKRVLELMRNLSNSEWNKDEFIVCFFNTSQNYHQRSLDLVVYTFALKSTKLVVYLANETFELILEFLHLTHSSVDYDNRILGLMENVLKMLELDQPNRKASPKSHYLFKIIIEKSKNTSHLIKLVPQLKQNILKGLQDEHSFNKYSTLYALMIEHDNERFDCNSSASAKLWLDRWLKPVLDIFCNLSVGLKDLFVGQFIPKLYKSVSIIMLKCISMDEFQTHLLELSLNTDAIFIILNKMKISIDFESTPLFQQKLNETIFRVISHPDGILAVESLKFFLTAIPPHVIIEEKLILHYQFHAIRLFIDNHSNDESTVVRKRFQQELTTFFLNLMDLIDFYVDAVVKGVIGVVECCLHLLTPSTTFGQNTIACCVIQLAIKIFFHRKLPNTFDKIKKHSVSFVCKQLELLLVNKGVTSCLTFLLMDNFSANKDLICDTLCCILKLTSSSANIYDVNDIKSFISIILTYDINNLSSTEFFSGYFLSILSLYDKDLIVRAFQQLDYPIVSQIISNKTFASGSDFLIHITLSFFQSYRKHPKLYNALLRLSTLRKFISFPIHMFPIVDIEHREFLAAKYGSVLLNEIDHLLCYSSMVSNRIFENEALRGAACVTEEHVVLWWKITRDCCTLSSMLIEMLLDIKIRSKQTYSSFELEETVIFRICAHYLNIFVHGTHMGLYNATNDAFFRVLEAVWKCKEFHHIPQQLLSQVLSLIIKDSSNVNGVFSIPRRKRSAGIPLFFQTIIESSPAQFRKTLVQMLLQEIGKTVVDTWKKVGRAYFPNENEHLLNSYVAFLNILQHLIEMASISILTEPFLKEMFKFVVEGLGSDEFLVKNCCQLLYGKIYKRIFNPQLLAKKLTIQQFNTRYPSIFNDVIMLLRKYNDILSFGSNVNCTIDDRIKHYFYPICSVLHLLIQLHPATENISFSVEVNKPTHLTTHEQTMMMNLSNLLQSLKSISYMNVRQMAYKCIVSLYSLDWACHLFKTSYASFKKVMTTLVGNQNSGYENGDIDELKLDEIYGDYLYIKASLKVINNRSLDETNRSIAKLKTIVDPILLSFILNNNRLEYLYINFDVIQSVSIRNSRMDLYCKTFIYDIHVILGGLLTFRYLLNECTLKIPTDLKFFKNSHPQCFQLNVTIKSLLKNTVWLYFEAHNPILLTNILTIMDYCHWKLIANHLFNTLKAAVLVNSGTNFCLGGLKIVSKMMDLSKNFCSKSISQEIMIKALLLEIQFLNKFEYPEWSAYTFKCYTCFKHVDINSLTTQNMILFIEWCGKFVYYYLISYCHSLNLVKYKDECYDLVYMCCEIILLGSSVCRSVQCRQTVVDVLSYWNLFNRCCNNSPLQEILLYSVFYATLTLIFDEDRRIRNSIIRSAVFHVVNDEGDNFLKSNRSCCKTLFHVFYKKIVDSYSSEKCVFVFWDLLLDPTVTEMIVNPTKKFNSIVKNLNIGTKNFNCLNVASSSVNSINNQYKYGIYSSALNSYYEWDTVQNCSVDILFSHYEGSDLASISNSTYSNVLLDSILEEKCSKRPPSIELKQCLEPALNFIVGQLRTNLKHFDVANSSVLYGTCLALGLLLEMTANDPSGIALIKSIPLLPPLPSNHLSHFKLNLLHEKLSRRHY